MGVALTTGAAVLTFLAPRWLHLGVVFGVSVVAILAVGNAVYDEHQIDVRRQHLEQFRQQGPAPGRFSPIPTFRPPSPVPTFAPTP